MAAATRPGKLLSPHIARTMKKTALALALLTAAVMPAIAPAADSDLSVKLDLPYTSRYVYRGLQFARASIQPSIDLSRDSSYAGAWFNSPITGGQKNEFNFYLGSEVPASTLGKDWKFDLGGRAYYFPQGFYTAGQSKSSFEGYAGITGGTLVRSLAPSLYAAYDFKRGSYNVIGSLGASLPIEKFGFALRGDLHAGYTAFNRATTGKDYAYWGAGLTLPYKFSGNATFNLGAQYDSSDLKGARHNLVTFTAGVTVGF
jgi:uncharacterized protein (TIGR02001 family)